MVTANVTNIYPPMPVTKAQSLRLEILDELLGSNRRTFQELLAKVNQRLYPDFKAIGKRTLLRDLDFLIDEKHAPVHRPTKADNFYYYTEKFSLKNIPIDQDELASLRNAIDILKQVDNFSIAQEVDYVIRKLENRLNVDCPDEHIYVQFERHTSARGAEYIDELLDAIKGKNALRISYQPYTHKEPSEKIVHPYMLKEFRRRWFLIGREGDGKRISNYAMDRIKKLRLSNDAYIENDLFDPEQYFSNLIGVSVPEGAKPEKISIKVYKQAVPYILSKPIHLNQTVEKVFADGSMLVNLRLIVNYELKSILLSYGTGISVRGPKYLRTSMKELIIEMSGLY